MLLLWGMKLSLALVLGSILLSLAAAKAVEGSPQAVQSAIDSAPNGGTVTINPGSYNWSSSVKIAKFVKLVGTGVTLNSTMSASLFVIEPVSSGSIELSGLTFNGASGLGAYIKCADRAGKPPLVHDCVFNATGFGKGAVLWEHNGGVIYQCTFNSTDKADNSAIQLKNDHSESAWKEADCLGMADSNGDKNTYIEDCSFNYEILQALDFDGNSRTVVRHCTFNNAAITGHGVDTGPVGSRAWEIYDNTFLFTNGSNNNPPPGQFPLALDYLIYIRCSGPGVLFGNTIPDLSSSAWGNKSDIKMCQYNIRRSSSYIPCQTKYPAFRQIGFGADAQGREVSSPVYIWGNTGGGNYDNPGIADYNPDDCGNNQHTADYVKKGRDYFLGTPKPGYSAYTYPHPLRTGGGGPTPSPTPSPTATPAPTATPPPSTPSPTPAPTATPTPAPTPSPSGANYSDWLNQLSDWIRQHPAVPNK